MSNTLQQLQSLPGLGTFLLYAILVSCGYAFGVSVVAGYSQPRLLRAARLAAYGTVTLVLSAVLFLAYAFLAHDFRIRYVSRYSDRAMDPWYLFASLWGGQDGSLLWWLFLLSLYLAAALIWMRDRYRELQPYVIASMTIIMGFFASMMIFSANPFEAHVTGSPLDGEGLNPLLQNYWMMMHPPALYGGFVGCAVPFSFSVAALLTGRLDSEWVVAARKWTLFAWLFLSIGNSLGMIWAYEELGWGGFWAWDPVENAGALPWFLTTAYLHSTILQERRQLGRLWNMILIHAIFFFTIFGTFLTRSGLIASVHSFAQSDIGVFFLWAMGFLAAFSTATILWRLPKLAGDARLESPWSREALFLVNNWAMVAIVSFVTVLTLWPKISEWLLQETVTLGASFFNLMAAPIGLLVLYLMAIAPVFGWRKSNGPALWRGLRFPLLAAFTATVAHALWGAKPAYGLLQPPETGSAPVVRLLEHFGTLAPLLAIGGSALTIAVVAQEFWLGVRARQRVAEQRGGSEGRLVALGRLMTKNKRRYGGYIVHLGVAALFIGFAGAAATLEVERTFRPGETLAVAGYELTYRGPRMCPGNASCTPAEQADRNKRMLFATVDVKKDGQPLGTLEAAKFIFTKRAQMPTTEVALHRALDEDLYIVLAHADPVTKTATLQIHVNPLVSWIWVGLLVVIGGTALALWPDVRPRRLEAWSLLRRTLATAVAMGFFLQLAAATAGPRVGSRSVAAQPHSSEVVQ